MHIVHPPPDETDETSCYKFFFKKYITPFYYLLKFNLPLILAEELMNFKLSIIRNNSLYIKNEAFDQIAAMIHFRTYN